MAAFVPSAGIYSENNLRAGISSPFSGSGPSAGTYSRDPLFSLVTIHIPQVSPPLFDAVRYLF
jgi:hypothetical protein